MKRLKKFEDIKSINSSEFDGNWDIGSAINKQKYIGKKNLDLKKGAKFEKILNENRIFIDSIGKGKFLTNNKIVLPPEKDFQEFRVTLGTKRTLENFIDYEYSYSLEDYEELDFDEQEKIDKEFSNIEIDTDIARMEFSVFLPLGLKNITHAALADALEYMKLIKNSIPNMLNGDIIENSLIHDIDNFKKFINNKKIKITNENIELAPLVNYRLYKDSKFFYEFKEGCENQDIYYKDLINDLLNI